MNRKRFAVKPTRASENTGDDCAGSAAVGETGPSTVKKIKDFISSLDEERWEELIRDARSFSSSQMHLPSLRAGAALDHLTDDQHENVVEYVRGMCGETLGVTAAVNLVFLAVSTLVLEKQILLSKYPEELQKESSDAMKRLVESLKISCGRQVTKPSRNSGHRGSHELYSLIGPSFLLVIIYVTVTVCLILTLRLSKK